MEEGGGDSAATPLCFSGSFLISGGFDKTVAIWDVGGGYRKLALKVQVSAQHNKFNFVWCVCVCMCGVGGHVCMCACVWGWEVVRILLRSPG